MAGPITKCASGPPLRMASALRPLALLALLLTAATAANAATVVTFNPDGSLSFDGYTLKTDGTVVDSKGKPVTPTENADGSKTVASVYTAYPNGTLTAPGVALYTQPPTGLTVGTTTLLSDGSVTDSTGMLLFGTVNPDKSYTVGDVTGWSNGTIVGPGGVVVNTGIPFSVDPTTGIVSGAQPPAAPPAPPPAPEPVEKVTTVITINGDRSLSFDGYTLLKNLTVLDSSGNVVTPTANADGSYTVASVYSAYPNKTLTAPGVTLVFTDLIKITVGKTSFFSDGAVLDQDGNPVYGTVKKDGSWVVGDFTGWNNGTLVGSNGATIHTGLQYAADPSTGIISTLTPSPPPAPSSPPAPKPAGEFDLEASGSASNALPSFVTAVMALVAPFLLL
ncbi:unnamed protein product [Closterium sp. Yama58-4]|nr:unnamed protein product [Closterium sp. Yama58-4]